MKSLPASAPRRRAARRAGARPSLHSLIILLAVVATAPLGAQESVYAPLVLQLPASVRATGMGGAWTSGRDADAIFFNPANAGVESGVSVGAGRYRDVSTFAHVGSAMSMGSSGIAVGVAWLGTGTSAGRNSWRSLGFGGPLAATSAVGSVAASMTWKGMRFGAAGKAIEEQVGTVSQSTAALDLGVAKSGDRIRAGLSVQNIGPSLGRNDVATELPVRAALGVSAFGFDVGPFELGASLDASVLRHGTVAAAGGAELSYVPLEGYLLAARVGVRRPEARALSPLSLGASFGLDRFTVDYAYEDIRAPGGGHHLGVRVH